MRRGGDPDKLHQAGDGIQDVRGPRGRQRLAARRASRDPGYQARASPQARVHIGGGVTRDRQLTDPAAAQPGSRFACAPALRR